MDKMQDLIQTYENHQFSSGPTTGLDYETFEERYKKILKDIANNIQAQLIDFNGGHYGFSAFMEKDGKFAYISISDVRSFKNEWKDDILVRTAENDRDFSGGRNTFTNLHKLESRLDKILS